MRVHCVNFLQPWAACQASCGYCSASVRMCYDDLKFLRTKIMSKRGVNVAIVMGNVGSDPELRYILQVLPLPM